VHGPCQGEEDDVSQPATKADLKEAFDSLRREVAELHAGVPGCLHETIKRVERDLTINFVVMVTIAAILVYALVL
jgi:hypothetical protein